MGINLNKDINCWHDTFNARNERLQYAGNITLNLDYWDCECKNNYIYPITQQYCCICDSLQEERPSSIESEVQNHLFSK